MRDKYEMQLRKLHAEMIEMGTMIEQAIETAIKALVAQDTELAKKAIEADDAIDHQEREIENLCLKLFLTQQPVAGDMRNISAAHPASPHTTILTVMKSFILPIPVLCDSSFIFVHTHFIEITSFHLNYSM